MPAIVHQSTIRQAAGVSRRLSASPRRAVVVKAAAEGHAIRKVRGKAFVTKDVCLPPVAGNISTVRYDCWFRPDKGCLQNIDTDQIIPAEHLTLVPSDVSI